MHFDDISIILAAYKLRKFVMNGGINHMVYHTGTMVVYGMNKNNLDASHDKPLL
jgi:hypothetical protein